MVSGSVPKHRQVVRETNRMHDIHFGGKQIRNVFVKALRDLQMSWLVFKLTHIRQDPLDLGFWSFLTFLHHGIEDEERHIL